MSCVCVGGGGGCNVQNTTVQEYLTGFGVAYNPSDPMPYSVVLAAHTPASIGNFLNFYKNLGEACLRSRGLLFCNKTPGDCGQIKGSSGISSLQVEGQLGSTGIGVGSTLLSGLGIVSGPLLGVATAGAGIALSVVLQIFQNHAAAEARQENVLCQVIPQFNQLLAQVDAAVYSGQASPQQGISTIQMAASSFRNTTAQLAKPCNAFCAYAAICDAMADISQYLYGLTPIPGDASGLQVGAQSYDEIPQPGNGIPGSTYIPPTYATSGNSSVPVSLPSNTNASALLGSNISPLAIAAAVIFGLILFKK